MNRESYILRNKVHTLAARGMEEPCASFPFFFVSSRLCTKADAYNALIFFTFFCFIFSYLRFFLVLTANVTLFFVVNSFGLRV